MLVLWMHLLRMAWNIGNWKNNESEWVKKAIPHRGLAVRLMNQICGGDTGSLLQLKFPARGSKSRDFECFTSSTQAMKESYL